MKSAILRTAISTYLEDRCSDFEILHLNFFEKWLNPKVRNQRKKRSCAFAAVVTCIEMHCRKSKIEVADSKKFYLDVQDVFENLFEVYPDEQIRKSRLGSGSSVEDVFTYAMYPGLVVTTECRSPRPMNFYSYCCEHPPRLKISALVTLETEEAFEYACHTPIVGGMSNVYGSFLKCGEVIYQPLESELAAGKRYDKHAVVIVGNARIKIDHNITNFFVILNSHGKEFGYKGYALIPTNLVDEFWFPVLSNRQLKKICKGLTQQSHASTTALSKNQSGNISSSGNSIGCKSQRPEEGSQNSGSIIPSGLKGEARAWGWLPFKHLKLPE